MQTEIKNSIKVLQEGRLILYPTDTIWGIGCDATNPKAVAKIYELKQRNNSKALICFVADDRMLSNYVEKIPNAAASILQIAESPITIIYDNPKGVANNLIAPDNSLAIRIPNDEFCYRLCRKLNKPIVSTSANISGFPTPKSFKEISPQILKGVDYVVNLHHQKITTKPSSILKIRNDESVTVIRA